MSTNLIERLQKLRESAAQDELAYINRAYVMEVCGKAQDCLEQQAAEIELLRIEQGQYAEEIERRESRLRDRQNALDHAIDYGHRKDAEIAELKADNKRLRKALTDLREWYFGAEIAAVEIEQAFSALKRK